MILWLGRSWNSNSDSPDFLAEEDSCLNDGWLCRLSVVLFSDREKLQNIALCWEFWRCHLHWYFVKIIEGPSTMALYIRDPREAIFYLIVSGIPEGSSPMALFRKYWRDHLPWHCGRGTREALFLLQSFHFLLHFYTWYLAWQENQEKKANLH